MPKDMPIGYMNTKQAAAYLGYSASTFREYALRGAIPRCGPRRNRFRKEDLDAFMEDPNVFRTNRTTQRRRDGFTPVRI